MDKPESSNPVYIYPETPKIIRKMELLRKLSDIHEELKIRKERLKYNIFAGIANKSIEAQKQTIQELELQKRYIRSKICL